MKIVFMHGWGSGSFVWDAMIDDFQEYDCHVPNMGFVGEENIEIPEGKFVGIGHSLGGLWLLKHYPEQLSGFISVASFNCFYRHIPRQILSSMKRNIVKDTTNQLIEFWHHAGLDQPGGFKNLNPAKLVDGLSWLSKWEADIPENVPVQILASHDDHIVPEKMTQDVWKDHSIDWIENGGHMLPLTQSDWCIKNIKEFLNNAE